MMNSKIPVFFVLVVMTLAFHSPLRANAELTQELADRYEQMLIRSPQPGTALDRVIEWYSTQGGGLEQLQKRWHTAAESQAQNKAAYDMMQGLLAERLRTPQKAREFYQQAAKAGDPAVPARLLATLETAEGNFPAAAQAYELALGSKSLPPLDRMELMRSLALLHQRAFQDDKAMVVWREAIRQFPDDASVLEEAGEAFLAAAAYDEARNAFTQLRDKSERDPFRKIAASLRLARVVEREGKTEEAVTLYAQALAETSDGSWMNREVRGRIEELFRRKDDLPGLLAYYESRTKAVPLDAQSFAAQSNVYKDLNRGDEAVASLRKAAELAPENLELRVALIRLLDDQAKTEEALAEARELAKPVGASREVLLLLGNLQWKQFQATQKAEDQLAAISTWKRIAPEGSTDLAAIAQLAELLASNQQIEFAVEQWKRLIEISPSAADARQRLAEYEEKRGDPKAARAILADMISGDRATAENYLSLTRIQDRLKWADEAAATLKEGMAKFPKDYDLLSYAWRQAIAAKNQDQLTAWFPLVVENAPNAFFAEEAVKQYTSVLDSSEEAKKWLEKFAHESKDQTIRPEARLVWLRLAISQRDEAAAQAALTAIQSTESPIRKAQATADFTRAFASADQQIAALRAVAEADPRQAMESLRGVARIQAETRQVDQALVTISQLIERSPAEASLYLFYADTAASAGKMEAATHRLREGLRYVEDSGLLQLPLATLYQMTGKVTEASAALAEAFNLEKREAKRMEIFRRQIEIAMQTQGLDRLIAELREKQAKESGGGHYGVYLAEIYILQNDFLSAKEELSRSLGKNPDNPAAVAKLMDLADRGGDQVEGIRLAARLAELEPSEENRANAITRLIEAGKAEEAIVQLDLIRSELIQNSIVWNSVLVAMRQAGQEEWSEAILNEISANEPDFEKRMQLVEFRLSQGQYDAAESLLWQIVDSGNLGESLKVVLAASPPSPLGQTSRNSYQMRGQPLQVLAAEVQSSIQTIVNTRRGGYSRRTSRMNQLGQTSVGSTQPSAEQAQVRALFFLAHLANANQNRPEFLEKVTASFDSNRVPPETRFMLLSALNALDRTDQLIVQLAEDPKADLDLDRLILNSAHNGSPEVVAAIKKIQDRVSQADPKFDFSRLYQELSGEFRSTREGGQLDPTQKAEFKQRLEVLIHHPGRNKEPMWNFQLATAAAYGGDFVTAFKLMDELESTATHQPSIRFVPAQQIQILRGQLIMMAILAEDPQAQAYFDKWVAAMPASVQAKQLPSQLGVTGFSGSNSGFMILQDPANLVIGDSTFPVEIFRNLFSMGRASPQMGKMRNWFADRAKGKELDVPEISLVYLDWDLGKREEALKRVEAIHAVKATPRTAALLLEMYGALKQPQKALTVLDLAELQLTETSEVRELRRIRILREAGKLAQAKEAIETLSKNRVSSGLQQPLSVESQKLGIPAKPQPAAQVNSSYRSVRSMDPTEQIRNQISKLIDDKKIDEAERIARQGLARSLPPGQDHSRINSRRTLLELLKRAERTEPLKQSLVERLEKHPSDLDAAIRLAEIDLLQGNSDSVDRALEILKKQPEQTRGVGYLVYLLQSNGQENAKTFKALCLLLTQNPATFEEAGMNFNQLVSMAVNADSGAFVAESVANMPDQAYRRLFFRSRLMGQMEEPAGLEQLAEFAVQAGKPDQAILLLKRVVHSAQNPHSTFVITLRLAELQLDQNQTGEAAATLKALIETPGLPRHGSVSAGTVFWQLLSGVMVNQSSQYPGTDPLEKIAKLAEATGTVDLMLEKLKDSPSANRGLTPALMIRTYLNQPGIAQEWQKLAENDAVASNLNYSILTRVIKALVDQLENKPALVRILQKVPTARLSAGGNQSLSYLSTAIPLLAKYRDDPAIKKHLQSVVDAAIREPNAATQFINNTHYQSSLNELIEIGYLEEARKLFDLTTAVRRGGQQSNRASLAAVEIQLKLARGEKVLTQLMCAGQPIGGNQLRIHWSTSLGLEPFPSSDNSRVGPSWVQLTKPIPESLRPAQLEILAGSNPANLEKVAQVANPLGVGTVEVTAPANLGLLQARWKFKDGTTQSGPLTAYVIGENLLPQGGIPPVADGKPMPGFTCGHPGPWGKSSATFFSLKSPLPQVKIPLFTFKPEGASGVLVFTGWVKSLSPNGSMPVFLTEQVMPGRNPEVGELSLQRSAAEEWHQFVYIWQLQRKSFMNAPTLPKELSELRFVARMQTSQRHQSLHQIEGSWDGLQLVKLLKADPIDGADEFISEAGAAFSQKKYGIAVDLLFGALKENPQKTLQNNGRMLVESAQQSNRLSEVFSQLSLPALYLPNPLNQNQLTVGDTDFFGMLISEAVAPNAPGSAQKWLTQIRLLPFIERYEMRIDYADFKIKAERDSSRISDENVLALIGWGEATPRPNRLASLWQADVSKETFFEVLKWVDQHKRNTAILEILKRRPFPKEYQAAQYQLEAWLVAPTNPARALDLWQQSLGRRASGPNSAAFSEEQDRALMLRIAASQPQATLAITSSKVSELPAELNVSDLMTALQQWASQRNSNEIYQARFVAETLDSLASTPGPLQADFTKIWLDAEFKNIRFPDSPITSDRVKKMIARLAADGDVERMKELLQFAENNRSFSAFSLIDLQLEWWKKWVTTAQGNLDSGWPVVWYKSGSSSTEITVHWQWDSRPVDRFHIAENGAIMVSDQLMLPKINELKEVEVLFGELPTKLEVIGRIKGDKAEGSLPVSLPATNGFLQAVAVVGDRRILGPMMPVISGRRIFPAEGSDVKSIFTSAKPSIRPEDLEAGAPAPDGSPSVKFARSPERQFEGATFPASVGKVYVCRLWIRQKERHQLPRVGFTFQKSILRSTLEIRPPLESPTDTWLYLSAIWASSTQPEFETYFSNMKGHADTGATLIPLVSSLPQGLQIAGWEVIEVENGKYAEALAQYGRDKLPFSEPANMQKMINFAEIDPRAALHLGGWALSKYLISNHQVEDLLRWIRAALVREGNPLFPEPYLDRIYEVLRKVIDEPSFSDEVKWEALQIVLENPKRFSPYFTVRFQKDFLQLAKTEEVKERAKSQIKETLLRLLDDSYSGSRFLYDSLSFGYNSDAEIPRNFIRLFSLMKDEELNRKVQQKIGAGKRNLGEFSINAIQLSLQLASVGLPEHSVGAQRVNALIPLADKTAPPSTVIFWSNLLIAQFAERNAEVAVLKELRKRHFDKMIQLTEDQFPAMNELAQSARNLIQAEVAENNAEGAAKTADQLTQKLSQYKGEHNVFSLQPILEILDQLTAVNQIASRDALLQTVRHEAEKNPHLYLKEAYSKYIKLLAPSPTPAPDP